MGPLRTAWPELQIEIELALSNRLDDLLRRDVDVAARMTAPTQASLVARRVGAIPVGLFAHVGYLARHPAPAKPAGSVKRVSRYLGTACRRTPPDGSTVCRPGDLVPIVARIGRAGLNQLFEAFLNRV